MCGGFSATFSFRDIKVPWNLYGDLEFAPRYNIAPSQSVPVIIKSERGHEAKLMKWGLVPPWAPDHRQPDDQRPRRDDFGKALV